jgi:hypothetical protein
MKRCPVCGARLLEGIEGETENAPSGTIWCDGSGRLVMLPPPGFR